MHITAKYEDRPSCPYCGCAHGVSDLDVTRTQRPSQTVAVGEIDCVRCGQTFYWRAVEVWMWTTSKAQEDE